MHWTFIYQLKNGKRRSWQEECPHGDRQAKYRAYTRRPSATRHIWIVHEDTGDVWHRHVIGAKSIQWDYVGRLNGEMVKETTNGGSHVILGYGHK